LLIDQIIDIENHLVSVDDKVESCSALATNYKVDINERECSSLVYWEEWSRTTPFYPELENTKIELLLFSDLLEEYSNKIIFDNNKDPNWRGEMDKQIQIQKTKVKEEVLKIKISSDLIQ